MFISIYSKSNHQFYYLPNDLARILPLQARRGISGEMNCRSRALVENRAGISGSYAYPRPIPHRTISRCIARVAGAWVLAESIKLSTDFEPIVFLSFILGYFIKSFCQLKLIFAIPPYPLRTLQVRLNDNQYTIIPRTAIKTYSIWLKFSKNSLIIKSVLNVERARYQWNYKQITIQSLHCTIIW